MIEPYFSDDTVSLYLGDSREVLPELGLHVDLVLADPPYGETSLTWDRWPDRWLDVAAGASSSLWCFGSVRLFGEQWAQFRAAGWTLSQDVVWEKHNGASFVNDRFKRVHEIAAHWYRGPWSAVWKGVQTTPDATKRTVRRKTRPTHTGDIGNGAYTSLDGGPRMMRSVLQVRSMHGRAIHPTEKPIGILDPLIRYACPPGGGPGRSVRWVGQFTRGCAAIWSPCGRHRGQRGVRREGRASAGATTPGGVVITPAVAERAANPNPSTLPEGAPR